MLTDANVRSIRSSGAECFVCDERIVKGEPSIEVTFKLLISVTKEMHKPRCALELSNLLGRRISESVA